METNKFKGVRYCAISSNNKILAVERTPEIAYHKAIIAGESTPYIFRGTLMDIKTLRKYKLEALNNIKGDL